MSFYKIYVAQMLISRPPDTSSSTAISGFPNCTLPFLIASALGVEYNPNELQLPSGTVHFR